MFIKSFLRHWFALILAVVLAAHLACGGSRGSSPVAPSTIVSEPTAPPTAAPPVASAPMSACDRLPKVEAKSACGEWSPTLTVEVSDAIDRVIANYASVFELTATNERGDPHIIDKDGYFKAVVSELDKVDICAGWNPGESDVQVTTTNDFSDRFRVVTSRDYPWRGKASYVDSCRPAALPKATIDHVDWVFVTAYGLLRCDPGAGMTNPFKKGSSPQIPMGCEVSVTATPKTFGGLDVPDSVHGSEVLWEEVVGDAVFWPWEDEPFNITVSPRSVGPVKICATVQSVTGCLNGTVVE